jgi:hypothetical protein
MNAKIMFQPKPDATPLLVTIQVSDDLPNPQRALLEATSMCMENAMSDSPICGPTVIDNGKLVPVREHRQAHGW